MSEEQTPSVLRLRKRHKAGEHAKPTIDDGARLIRAQSVRQAVTASLIVIIVFAVLWSMLSDAMNRIFPWMPLLLGMLVGMAVRRAGLGLDWRFPAIAAAFTILGSFLGNIVIAASVAAEGLGTTTLDVLFNMSSFTLPTYFDEKVTAADYIYAAFAALVAAFYAKRRLNRRQYHALRLWEERDDQA